MLSPFSHVWLFATLWTTARQIPLSMGFSRQEYWSGLPCPSPGDLPNPWMEPMSLTSPALASRFFTTSTTWEAHIYLGPIKNKWPLRSSLNLIFCASPCHGAWEFLKDSNYSPCVFLGKALWYIVLEHYYLYRMNLNQCFLLSEEVWVYM